ncbi:LCP family protein [Antribacter gilvus]|uniref:LCP family protein n=1 Tax=Antribacter gilvus TaxID=2304675 RepID=UPI000F78D7E2|nr:LCP family protein [Antribacter gilvus]
MPVTIPPQHVSGPQPAMPKNPEAPAARHASGRGWSPVPRVVAMVVVGLFTLGGSSVAAVVNDLRSQIDISGAGDLVVGAEPEKPKDPDDPFKGVPVDILIIGTDYRDAENAALAGEDSGMRSDTMLWAHISADRTWMQVVSIPRDSMVRGVPCKMPEDRMTGDPGVTQINGSFSAWTRLSGEDPSELDYGAACTISTIIANTGMPVPHHVIVKMNGVIGIVEALGGVDVCLAEPMDQGKWGPLRLPAGLNHLNGSQAMHYVRARHGESGVGDQSDISRMSRQQGFINNVLGKILSGDTLTDVPKMINLTSAVLGSISPHPDLANPQNVAGLALSIKDIDRSRIVFTTTPWEAYPSNPAKIQWSDEADVLWDRLAADQPPPDLPPLPTAPVAPADGAPADGATDPGTTAPDAGAGVPDPGTAAPGTTDPGTAAPAAPPPPPAPVSTEPPPDGSC